MTSDKSKFSRFMGLDIGTVRIGVALSDPLGMFATPHSTIIKKKDQQVIVELVQLVTSQSVGTIVIGQPTELSGELGEQAKKVQEFAQKLAKACARLPEGGPKLVFWDERFSSLAAERIIAGSRIRKQDRHAAVDRVSASVILEGFLDSLRGNNPFSS